MAALFIAALEVPSARLISSVALIAIGTAIASYGEVNLSVLGVTFMFMSESFEATRLVMTQVLLVGLKFHPSASPSTKPLISWAHRDQMCLANPRCRMGRSAWKQQRSAVCDLLSHGVARQPVS